MSLEVHTRTGNVEDSFELTAEPDDNHRCVASSCDEAPHENFSLLLGADIRGAIADYGRVGFCSFECVEEFLEETPYYGVEDDIVVYGNQPIVAEIEHDELSEAPVDEPRFLAHSPGAAAEKAGERLTELADKPIHSAGDFSISVREF